MTRTIILKDLHYAELFCKIVESNKIRSSELFKELDSKKQHDIIMKYHNLKKNGYITIKKIPGSKGRNREYDIDKEGISKLLSRIIGKDIIMNEESFKGLRWFLLKSSEVEGIKPLETTLKGFLLWIGRKEDLTIHGWDEESLTNNYPRPLRKTCYNFFLNNIYGGSWWSFKH